MHDTASRKGTTSKRERRKTTFWRNKAGIERGRVEGRSGVDARERGEEGTRHLNVNEVGGVTLSTRRRWERPQRRDRDGAQQHGQRIALEQREAPQEGILVETTCSSLKLRKPKPEQQKQHVYHRLRFDSEFAGQLSHIPTRSRMGQAPRS